MLRLDDLVESNYVIGYANCLQRLNLIVSINLELLIFLKFLNGNNFDSKNSIFLFMSGSIYKPKVTLTNHFIENVAFNDFDH